MPSVRPTDPRTPWLDRRVFGEGDCVTLLTFYIVLLLAIPSRLTVASLGAFGTPAVLLGVTMSVLWVVSLVLDSRTADEFVPRGPRHLGHDAIGRAAALFALAALASWIAAAARPSVLEEWKVAQLPTLTLFSWLGVFAFTSYLMPSTDRLRVFVRRLALGGGLVALVGILQFVTSNPLTQYIQIPGLSLNQELLSLGDRDGLNRPSGTAIHAIEFGVSIAALLPLAIHVAVHDRHLSVLRRWFPVAAIGIATFLAVSRSSVLCAGVAMLVLLPSWPRIYRVLAAGAALVITAGVAVIVPGLFNSITGLFTGISGDTSALSRTDSYVVAFDYISRSPWFGRGFGTFLPRYKIFDNAYLLLGVGAGVIGVVALLILFVTGIAAVLTARRRLGRHRVRDRDLGVSIAASIASAAAGFAFFDALSFPMYSGLVFLVLGLAAAYVRLMRDRAGRAPLMIESGGSTNSRVDEPTSFEQGQRQASGTGPMRGPGRRSVTS